MPTNNLSFLLEVGKRINFIEMKIYYISFVLLRTFLNVIFKCEYILAALICYIKKTFKLFYIKKSETRCTSKYFS